MIFADFNLPASDQTNFNCYDYQKDHWLLIVFFRGAWCVLCKKQLKELQDHLTDLTKLKVKVIAISNDTRFKSSLLQNFFQLQYPVLSDIQMQIIKREKLETVYKNQITAKPACFILDPQHRIQYSFVGQSYDDRPSIETLIAEIKKLQA